MASGPHFDVPRRPRVLAEDGDQRVGRPRVNRLLDAQPGERTHQRLHVTDPTIFRAGPGVDYHHWAHQ